LVLQLIDLQTEVLPLVKIIHLGYKSESKIKCTNETFNKKTET
jgi:hypothetical protein